jgi:hypothetical protein
MLRTRNLTLNGTAQELTIDDVIDTPNTVSIQNLSDSGFAYLGNEIVTTSNYGHKLFPGQSFSIELNSDDKLWAVGDSGVTVAVLILEKI